MTPSSSLSRPWECCWTQLTTLVLSLILLSHGVTAQLNNDTSPTHIFRSRPDLHAPIIDLKILRPELVTPGYIFLAPYRNRDPGPYIYDNFGNLVWSGAGMSGPKVAHAPHTCQYKGEKHLCFFQGEQHQGFARGHGTILDKNYRVVKTIDSSGSGVSSDMHEFRMTPHSNGTTVLMTVYQPRHYDLAANPRYRVAGGMGWLVEGVFQEVDIETGKVVFEWRSTDHLDPSLSYTFPGTTDTSGDGLSEDTPWDYFHINSIDKNTDGDYLISARHMAGIYKLSGVDGHVMWELGGANPTFNQTNFRFSSQHHARWVSENATHTVLSFFDNASNTFNMTNRFSHGYIILINHIENTATAIKSWGAPEAGGGLLSGSQGNLQLLPGGNVHLGWGEHAFFSEHTWDGSPVQYGIVAQRLSNVMIYRSNKFNWTGTPVSKPAVWTYAQTKTAEAGMVIYVSWNGATEVHAWNFYSASSSDGPFELIGTVEKNGFETAFRHRDVQGWAFAEALDRDGRPLDRSVIAKTFIPSDSLRPYCDDWSCSRPHKVEDVDYDIRYDQFQPEFEHLSPNRGYNTSRYYADLPSVNTGLKAGYVDVGSLVLGMGLALMAMSAVITAAYVIRCNYISSAQLSDKAASIREHLLHSKVGTKFGRYMRISEEVEEKTDAPPLPQ